VKPFLCLLIGLEGLWNMKKFVIFLLLGFNVNAQELLEVTTKLCVKLNNPVIEVEQNCMCQLSKVPLTDSQKFLSRMHLKSVSSSVLNMMNFDVGELFANAATSLTYHSKEKKHFY
jgi:hypothetical protein